jgi:anti-sigma regulatory factor (Ser/Thr protein kinase)
MMSAQRQYRAAPDAPMHARHDVDRLLQTWGLHDVRDQAALLTTELVSNAVRHAGTDIDVSVTVDDDVLRVEVRDQVLDRAPRLGDPYGSGGYGLHIVAALADAWGHQTLPNHKSVWFELKRPQP